MVKEIHLETARLHPSFLELAILLTSIVLVPTNRNTFVFDRYKPQGPLADLKCKIHILVSPSDKLSSAGEKHSHLQARGEIF